jgi:hypothetical protein
MSIGPVVLSDSEHFQQWPMSEQLLPQSDTDDSVDNAVDCNVCGMSGS